MNTKEKLSIIIPHYNSINELDRLLESIYLSAEITLNNLEVIVVDDNSTIRIISMKKKWTQVIFISNYKDNKGAGSCRNIGLSVATGDWILFADADDFLLNNYYKNIIRELDNDSDIIYFIPTSVDEESGEISNRHEYFEELMRLNSPDKQLLLKFKIVVPWSKVYRYDYLKINNILFDEVIVSNDVMFSARCGVSNPNIKLSYSKIYCVTKSEGSLTTTLSTERYFQRLEVFIKSSQFIRKSITLEEYKILDINGGQFIINMFSYKLKPTDMFIALSMLRNGDIKLLSLKKIRLKYIKKNFSKFFLEKKYSLMKD